MPGSNIGEVITRHTSEIMALPGVAGVAEGTYHGKPCIMVFVTTSSSEIAKQIPEALEGFPVKLRESGEFRKTEKSKEVRE